MCISAAGAAWGPVLVALGRALGKTRTGLGSRPLARPAAGLLAQRQVLGNKPNGMRIHDEWNALLLQRPTAVAGGGNMQRDGG